jgi:hypothetical protein
MYAVGLEPQPHCLTRRAQCSGAGRLADDQFPAIREAQPVVYRRAEIFDLDLDSSGELAQRLVSTLGKALA